MARYSVQPRGRIFIKSYGILSFATNTGRLQWLRQRKTFFYKMKNLCLLSPCFLHLKLKEATNSFGKQALVIKLLFLKNNLDKIVIFPGILGTFGSSGNQPRGTALYSEVFLILHLSFPFNFWLQELSRSFRVNGCIYTNKFPRRNCICM